MLKTKIYAGSVSNLTDARYFAAWEAEWLGFNFDPGADEYLTPANMIAVKDWTDGVKITGEFGIMHSPEDVRAAIDLVGLDAIHLGMYVESETASQLADTEMIKEFVVQEDTTETDIKEHIYDFAAFTNTFLLDFTKTDYTWERLCGEEGISVSFLREICQEFRVIVALDFTGETVEKFLETVFPYGIRLKGGAEEKVGFKSFDEIDEVLEAIEIYR